MKRNNLTTAILAGITGVAGIASVSNAVNLNSDGIGQVLVYPYYTVNNGYNTLISVVNTTEDVKAVKVRFLEGQNSRECLDFNLYMSPYDVWTAALVPATSTVATLPGVDPFTGQSSVKLLTSDTSCTAPAINGQEFLPYAFITSGTIDADDGLGTDLVRCTEGHFEMIEMGTVVAGSDAAIAATHSAGVPDNCGLITSRWTSTGSAVWLNDSSVDMAAPDGSGGLFGSASLINVDAGTDVSYNADAIQSYSTNLQHSDPGNQSPSLKSGNVTVSHIFDANVAGNVATNDWGIGDGVEAVSALYMHDHVYGEYALEGIADASTEWIVTFPTKFAYVDAIGAAATTWTAAGIPQAPFTREIDPAAGGACEEYAVEGYWDREERVPTVTPGSLVPSPLPPGVNPNIPVFCKETNVLQFVKAGSAVNSIFGSNNATTATVEFNEGWMALNFDVTDSISGTNDHVTNSNDGPTNYWGLPVTGFAVQKYTNDNLAGGVLANYAGLFAHRYSKKIN